MLSQGQPKDGEPLVNPLLVDFLVLPVIGAIHGWVTNLLAIRLLFRPRRPIRFLLWTVQGVVPRRRADLAKRVAEIVEKDLLPLDSLLAAARKGGLDAQIEAEVTRAMEDRLEEILPRFLPGGLRLSVKAQILRLLIRETVPAVTRLLDSAGEVLGENLKIGAAVEARLLSLDLSEVEAAILRVAGREIGSIVRLGFFMGLGIGLVQGILLLILRLKG